MLDTTAQQILLLDPTEYAEIIEQRYNSHLKPYVSGYYLPGIEHPVMVAGKYYTYIGPNNTTFPVSAVTDLSTIASAIYDQYGEVAVERHKVKQLTTVPHAPYRGINLIRDLVENCVDRLSVWRQYAKCGAVTRDMGDVLHDHLDPEFVKTTHPGDLDVLAEQINGLLIDLRSSVVDFASKDKWVIHIVRTWRTDIVVEKTVDYRIHAWEQANLKK